MEVQKNMATIIRALKQQRGLSLTEFADELEISRSALQEYLSGTGNPTLTTVEHLAHKLGIPLAALVSGAFSADQFSVLMTLLDLFHLLSGLSPHQRHQFIELLQGMLALWEGDDPHE